MIWEFGFWNNLASLEGLESTVAPGLSRYLSVQLSLSVKTSWKDEYCR